MIIPVPSPKVSKVASSAIANHAFSAPAGSQYELVSLYVTFTSSATVGNRNLEVQIIDPAGTVVASYTAGVTQAASLTRKYFFYAFGTHLTAFYDTDKIIGFIPGMYLPAGFTIKVIDNKAVDAADTAVSALMVRESAQ